jgi:hypothetical protein
VNWGANRVGAKPRPTVIFVLHMTIVMCAVIYICDHCVNVHGYMFHM